LKSSVIISLSLIKETILEGSVDEIRRNWAANEYDGLHGDVKIEEMAQLPDP